jgi:hypothetical protein
MTEHLPLASRRRILQFAAALPAAAAFASAAQAAPSTFTLAPATDEIKPFKVSVPQAAIDDLKQRLKNARWPDKETMSDWSQGVPLDKAKKLISYWAGKYDWRRFEKQINAYPQFRTEIDGLGIHFIHVKSKHRGALLVHRHGRLLRADLLGECPQRRRFRRRTHRASHGGDDLPEGDLPRAEGLGGGTLAEPHLLERGRQGRPLRRLRTAAALFRRDAQSLQVPPLNPKPSLKE